MSATPTPPVLNGFKIGRLLGQGGMATVWEAHQIDPDRMVAIKVLDAGIASNPRDIDAFYSEAKAAAALDHPNIVTVFELGCQKGLYYYVMELAAGYDTGKWLARKGHLTEQDALTIAESVGIALDYADRTLGLTHCDIKPSNIMVDDDGTVRVTDMGIARFPRSTDTSDCIAGTPEYMSPEQAAGVEALDARADIYSLGATLYHYLSGRPLFGGRGETETLECQRSACAPDVRTMNPAVSAPCAVMIARFLAKDRADRPSGWGEAIAMVREAMALGEAAARGAPRPARGPLASFDRPSSMALGDRAAPLAAAQAPAQEPKATGEPKRPAHFPSTSFWIWTALASAAAFVTAFIAARFF